MNYKNVPQQIIRLNFLLGFKTVIFFMKCVFNSNSKIASRTKQIHWQQMVASFDVLPNVSLISFSTNFTLVCYDELVQLLSLSILYFL